MRKKLTYFYSLLLTALFLLPWNVINAETATFYDGITTSQYHPFYGSYCDQYVRSQMIYPASSLSSLSGKKIEGMTFYLTSAVTSWGVNFEVYLSEVTASNFNESTEWNSESVTSVLVYSGSLSGTGAQVPVAFTTSYVYGGGNLMVEFKTTSKGSYPSTYFYGTSAGSSIYSSVYGKKASSTTFNASGRSKFLAKVTIEYSDAAPVTCPKPSDLTQGAVSHNSAAFTWTAGGEEASWQYVYLPAATTLTDEAWNGATAGSVNTPAVTLSGLSAATNYKLYVRAYCSSSDQSANISKEFRTNNIMPFSEDFTGLTSGIPTAWDNSEGTTTTESYKWNYNNSGHDAAPCVRFNSSTNGTDKTNILKTPAIYIDKVAALSFWYKNPSGGDFSVYYSIDGVKQADALATGLTGATDWTNYEVALPAACVGHNVKIFFQATSNYGNSTAYIYLDDVVIEAASSCAKPSDLSAYATSGTTASVSWTAGGEETAWNLQFSTDNFSTFTERTGITANPYNLTGLSAETTYKVRIQADCGGAQSGFVTSSEFTTPCAAVDGIGWSEDFETATAGSGNIPGCWQKISNSNGDLQVSATNYYQKEGSTKCLYFYSGTTTTPRIAIFPPFNEATNTLQVVLDYAQAYEAWSTLYDYTDEDYGQLSIGYITNPKDASTFEAQETLLRVSTYTQAKVALTNAPAGSRVAIRYGGGSNSGYLFVDNVSITALPTCLTPTGVTGAATAYNQATISWNVNGSESAWKIQYSSDGGSTWSAEQAVSTNPFTLNSLSGNTSYVVRVKADCGGGEFSDWSAASAPFHTPCAPADASDYSENFESATVGEGNLPDCWQYKDAYDDSWDGRFPQVYNSGAYQGSKLLYFYGGGAASVNTVLLPPMDETLDGLTVEFFYSTSVNFSTIVYGSPVLGYIAADGTTFVEIETLAQSADYILYKKDLSSVPATAKYLAISYANGTAGSGHMYLDNVRVYPTPNCLDPTGVTVSNVTATTADVAWTENNGKSTWKLQISNDGSAWTDVNGGADITANPYTLTGLTPNHTTYYVRVKTICGVGDESPWSAASAPFETECGTVALPFNEDFSGSIGCWTVNGNASIGISGEAFRFAYPNYPQYLISPEIDTDDKPVTVGFDYWAYSSSYPETFQVGYSTTTNAVSAFTWGTVQTCKNTSSASPDAYNENLPVGVKYVAVKYLSNDKYYLYIDNFSVVEYIAPACPVVSAATLQESAVTAHTATVSWTAGGEETAWNLQYKAADGEWSEPVAISTTPSYDMTSLTANTLYYVKVQANCGDATSEWTGNEAFSFRTDCEPKAVSKASPWEYGFEDVADGEVPSCWDRKEAYANHGYPVVVENSSSAQNGDKYLYFYTPARNGGQAYTEDAILPVFNTEIKNLKVSFAYFNNSTGTNYGQLAIGYVVGDAFTQVGELVAKVEDYTTVEREMPNDAPDGARIAIRCIGSTKSGYSTYAYVDDIVVSLKPTCYTPTALAAAATSDGAVLTWTAGKDESEWNVRYSVKDADSWTVVSGISAETYTIEGLAADITYEAQVRSFCGGEDYSNWTASVEFTPVCNAPTALTVTARTQTSATFAWTSTESAWKLQYKADADADWTEVNVNANPFTLTGLSAGTNYQAKLQSACGSAFADAVSFTTWCDSKLSLPVEQTSFSAIPACWEESPANAIEIAQSKLCFVGEGERFLYLPQSDINLNLLSVTLTFSGSLELGYISEPNGAFTSLVAAPVSGTEYDLASLAPEAAKYLAVRYNGASNLSQSTISAVNIRRTPDCAKLDAPAATPSTTSASISWTAGSETAWNLQYKLASAADWTTVAITENPYTLNSLAEGTEYKVRVQANCGDETGDWSDETTFTTYCEAISTLPWNENFNADLSACWTLISEDETYYPAGVFGGELYMPGGKSGSSQLLVLPKFTSDILNRTDLTISFTYRAETSANAATPEVGVVDVGNNFTPVASLEKSATYFELPLSQFDAAKRIAIRYAGGSSEGNLYIDNLSIATVVFNQTVDNAARFAALNGVTLESAVVGRTIFHDGYYNTICLPFSIEMSTLAATPLAGAEKVMKFISASVNNDILDLNIEEVASDETLEAGKPYLVQFAAGTDQANPSFANVTIAAAEGQAIGTGDVKFVGVLSATVLASDKSQLFVGANNTLYWPKEGVATLNAFRAYFDVNAGGANHMPIHKGMKARFVEGHGAATDVENVAGDADTIRKVLENGQIVIIRDNKRYTVMGQVIE